MSQSPAFRVQFGLRRYKGAEFIMELSWVHRLCWKKNPRESKFVAASKDEKRQSLGIKWPLAQSSRVIILINQL